MRPVERNALFIPDLDIKPREPNHKVVGPWNGLITSAGYAFDQSVVTPGPPGKNGKDSITVDVRLAMAGALEEAFVLRVQLHLETTDSREVEVKLTPMGAGTIIGSERYAYSQHSIGEIVYSDKSRPRLYLPRDIL